MATQEPEIKISRRKMMGIVSDPEKTALIVNLVYVKDSQEGIRRIKEGDGFKYVLKNKKVKGKAIAGRIKSLAIPPAWENVWVCILDNGHLQATGFDVKKRKQYKYHPLWNSLRNHTKYYRLLEFSKALSTIRKHLENDLSLPGLPLEKVLALVVCLMEKTNIRVGNNYYEKLYGSFGITTLKDKHVAINGSSMKFSFTGKKGVAHTISLKNRKLAVLLRKCRDIPGKELFQYYDVSGVRKSVDSGMVNDYIKAISGTDFSAKDFRTWAGTVCAIEALKKLGDFETLAEGKKKILEALDTVAATLGNTRNVCKKYYIHPAILTLYEQKSLQKFFEQPASVKEDESSLSPEERILIKVLEAN